MLLKYIDGELRPVSPPKEGILHRPMEVVLDSLIVCGLHSEGVKALVRKSTSWGNNFTKGIIEYIFRFESTVDIKKIEKAIQLYFTICGAGDFYLERCFKSSTDCIFEYSWNISDRSVPEVESKIVTTALEKGYVEMNNIRVGYTNYNDWYETNLGVYIISNGRMKKIED